MKRFDIPISALAEYEAAVAREEDDEWFDQFAERFIDPEADQSDFGSFDDVELRKVGEAVRPVSSGTAKA